MTDVKKEKELKNKKKKYSIDNIKNMLLRICREYNLGWDTDKLKVRDTVNNSILITGIPRKLNVGAFYSGDAIEYEKEYFSKIISSILKYFNNLGIPCHFDNTDSITRGRLELYFE